VRSPSMASAYRYYRIAGGPPRPCRPVFLNDGRSSVNYNQQNANTLLAFADTTSLQGTGTILLMRPLLMRNSPRERRAVLTQPSGTTIHGRGRIHAALVNHGVVRSDNSRCPSSYTQSLTKPIEASDGRGRDRHQRDHDRECGRVIRRTAERHAPGRGDDPRRQLERTGTSAEYATGPVTLDGVHHNGYYGMKAASRPRCAVRSS